MVDIICILGYCQFKGLIKAGRPNSLKTYISELSAGAVKRKHELEGESSLGNKRPKSNGN